MTRIPVTLFTSGILGFLCLVLSVLVSVARRNTNIYIGDGAGAPQAAPLLRAIRAQGNFVEYVPLLLILLGGIEVSGAHRLTCEIYGALLIISRISHAIGIHKPKPGALRGAGAMLTWLVLLGLSIEALLLLLQQPV